MTVLVAPHVTEKTALASRTPTSTLSWCVAMRARPRSSRPSS